MKASASWKNRTGVFGGFGGGAALETIAPTTSLGAELALTSTT